MARKYQMCALAYACQAFISFRDHDYYVRFEILVYIFGDIADVSRNTQDSLFCVKENGLMAYGMSRSGYDFEPGQYISISVKKLPAEIVDRSLVKRGPVIERSHRD